METSEKPSALTLQSYVEAALPDRAAPVIEGFGEISSGWESEVYAFDLVSGLGELREIEALALRIYPGADAHEKSEREYGALRRLWSAGYPVPEVLHLCHTGSPFGHPFLIMERVPGRPMWWETFNGPVAQQSVTFERFIRLFVELHALDWRGLVESSGDCDPTGWTQDPYVFVDRYMDLIEVYCDRFNQPGYLPLLAWLRSRRDRVPCERPAGIHWDYHPENLLITEDGTAYVIDWTQFEISDPRFDLAWTLTLLGAQEGDAVRSRIVSTYEAISGRAVAGLSFFEVLACVKRLASVTISLSAGAQAVGMRAGAEESMRQHLPILRRVYERLQALTGLSIPEVDALYLDGSTQ